MLCQDYAFCLDFVLVDWTKVAAAPRRYLFIAEWKTTCSFSDLSAVSLPVATVGCLGCSFGTYWFVICFLGQHSPGLLCWHDRCAVSQLLARSTSVLCQYLSHSSLSFYDSWSTSSLATAFPQYSCYLQSQGTGADSESYSVAVFDPGPKFYPPPQQLEKD